jgi:D-alanyl-lipoteichoic acid acyltransferase DltB (MBOAT superfamily)
VLFPTIDFAIFFGVVFVGNWLLVPHPTAWKVFILLASYVFYAWADWHDVLVLMGSTSLTYAGGRLVEAARSPTARRRWLVATVTAELGLLASFKYYGLFSLTVDNAAVRLGVHGAPVPLVAQAVFPIGISFYTFMGLSYVIDVYRGSLRSAPPLDVAVYASFFPHLLAGPIVRGGELLPQIARCAQRDQRHLDLTEAAFLIVGGLFKKVVLSSYVSSAIVTPVFSAPSVHSAPEILLAAYGYSVQIYCDFSGYTDIAIGCAMLLGFQFPQNFDAPYAARSLQEFWRRWNMTLSFWLRDYLYIPLGGNREGRSALYRNIMVTMVLGGLWHGAGWTFVAWGALHGIGQCIGHANRWRRARAGRSPQRDGIAQVWLERLATFSFVSLAWLFFDSSSIGGAVTLVTRLVTTWGQPAPLVRLPVVAVVVFALSLQLVPSAVGMRARELFVGLGTVTKGLVLGLALAVITTLGPAGIAPYIYFRF